MNEASNEMASQLQVVYLSFANTSPQWLGVNIPLVTDVNEILTTVDIFLWTAFDRTARVC